MVSVFQFLSFPLDFTFIEDRDCILFIFASLSPVPSSGLCTWWHLTDAYSVEFLFLQVRKLRCTVLQYRRALKSPQLCCGLAQVGS